MPPSGILAPAQRQRCPCRCPPTASRPPLKAKDLRRGERASQRCWVRAASSFGQQLGLGLSKDPESPEPRDSMDVPGEDTEMA